MCAQRAKFFSYSVDVFLRYAQYSIISYCLFGEKKSRDFKLPNQNSWGQFIFCTFFDRNSILLGDTCFRTISFVDIRAGFGLVLCCPVGSSTSPRGEACLPCRLDARKRSLNGRMYEFLPSACSFSARNDAFSKS